MYPITSRPKITDKELAQGYVIRYFARFIGQPKIIEIDKGQYDQLNNNSSYQTIKLKWIIGGNANDTYTKTGQVIDGTDSQNSKIVSVYNKIMPGLEYMLQNTLEYFSGKRVS